MIYLSLYFYWFFDDKYERSSNNIIRQISVKNILMLLLLVLLLIPGPATFAQEIPDEISSNSLYSQSKDIINGTKWVYEKKNRGIPYLVGNNWATGNVKYDSKLFPGVRFNYNLFTDEFIIFSSDEGNKKYVAVQKDFLESFSYRDTLTNKERFFEYVQLPGTNQKRLYEIIYQGKSLFMVRHIKAVRSKVADGFFGDYIDAADMYIKVDNTFETFSNKKDLLNILAKHTQELNKFIHKNKIKIKKLNYENIASVINYFDELEEGVNR
jgi:hypothetical protein